MAQSPAHRFGQIIGEVLEAGILQLLTKFARGHQLYLDQKGSRPCRRGTKCSWIDLNGNSHDLDFVLERGGTSTKIGIPVAFIETAWRRYTRHSRNKVQEIQGAIEPLVQTYRHAAPFKGAILGGVFTGGALAQLKSLGFTVLYFPYESILAVFRKYDIDASSDDKTPDNEFQRKVDAYDALGEQRKAKLATDLMKAHKKDVADFLNSLSQSVSRQIDRIVILTLHGQSHEVTTIEDAVALIESYDERKQSASFVRYEIHVRYNNGNDVRGEFYDKVSAVEFLRNYQPILPSVK